VPWTRLAEPPSSPSAKFWSRDTTFSNRRRTSPSPDRGLRRGQDLGASLPESLVRLLKSAFTRYLTHVACTD
jgi:hypothetical protein